MQERYTRTAMTLHWLIAAAVLAQIAFGWYLEIIPLGAPPRAAVINFHKSTGLLIGALIVFRLACRLTHTPPPLPESMPAWERRAALVNHVLLYACMLIMPIAGYTASNFSKFGVKFFNAVLLPSWGADDRGIYTFFNGLHVATSYVFVTLIAVHVAAALKHLIVPRHGIFPRIAAL